MGLSNPKLTEDYLLALLRANSYVYENRSGTLEMIRDFFKVESDTPNGFMIIECAIK